MRDGTGPTQQMHIRQRGATAHYQLRTKCWSSSLQPFVLLQDEESFMTITPSNILTEAEEAPDTAETAWGLSQKHETPSHTPFRSETWSHPSAKKDSSVTGN